MRRNFISEANTLQSVGAACDNVGLEPVYFWIQRAIEFFPHCLARKCIVSEVL